MNNIANKISRHNKDIYCGYLISTEILYLMNIGCKTDDINLVE